MRLKRRRRLRPDRLTRQDIECLLIGPCGATSFSRYESAPEAMRGDWVGAARRVLPVFIEANPGCRPWAWWEFMAPEPMRRQLGGDVTIGAADPLLGLCCGVPRVLPPGAAYASAVREAIQRRQPWPCLPEFESSAAYLDRHGLLGGEERDQLSPAAWAPVPTGWRESSGWDLAAVLALFEEAR